MTLLTLVVLTFNLLLIGFVDHYYAQRIASYQNEIFYYQKENQKMRESLTQHKSKPAK